LVLRRTCTISSSAQAQRKPIIEPNGTGNNLWRETVVLVINDGPVHAAQSIANLLSQNNVTSPRKHMFYTSPAARVDFTADAEAFNWHGQIRAEEDNKPDLSN
jgi:hypothetical protein